MSEATGFCECGCGERTTIITHNNRGKGLVAGQPRRFIRGHFKPGARPEIRAKIEATRRAKRAQTPQYRIDPETGCWIWQLSLINTGYGQLKRDGKQWLAHRWYFTQARGPIPEGQHLDHICRNRACVNPAHLRLATERENQQNRSPIGRGTSRFRGVSWDARAGKWHACVMVNRLGHHIGYFTSETEAGAAAARARADLMPFSPEARAA